MVEKCTHCARVKVHVPPWPHGCRHGGVGGEEREVLKQNQTKYIIINNISIYRVFFVFLSVLNSKERLTSRP